VIGQGVPSRLQITTVAALVAAATAVYTAGKYGDWFGSWGELSRALEDSTTLTFPLLAAMGAWVTTSPVRKRFEWMIESSSRSRYAVLLGWTAMLTAGASFGHLAVSSVVHAMTFSEATYGRPVLLSAIVIIAGFFASCAFGSWLGTFLPPLVAPAAAIAGVYGILLFADTGKQSLMPLAGLTVSDPRERTYRYTEWWMLDLRVLWLLAMGLLFVALAADARRRLGPPFIAGCVLATPLLFVGSNGMVVDSGALESRCHQPEKDVTVCFTAARDHAYAEMAEVLKPMIAELRGLVPQWRFVEETISERPDASMSGGVLTSPFSLPNGVSGNSHVVNRGLFLTNISTRILQSNCTGAMQGVSQVPYATVNDVIQSWLLKELSVDLENTLPVYDVPRLDDDALDYSRVQKFRDEWEVMPRDERQEWLGRHREELLGCTLTDEAASSQ
jgi:hypothetical protein